MADPRHPAPLRLALFLQAVSSRLTGAQLEDCLREVTHFNGLVEAPVLDARQLRCVSVVVGDPSMSEVYGFEVEQLLRERAEARRLAARCRAALRSLEEDGRYASLRSDLAGLKDRLGWSLDQAVANLNSVAAMIEAAAVEAEQAQP